MITTASALGPTMGPAGPRSATVREAGTRTPLASRPIPSRSRIATEKADGKLLALVLGVLLLPLAFALPAWALNPGDLDTSFSGDGIEVAPAVPAGLDSSGNAVADLFRYSCPDVICYREYTLAVFGQIHGAAYGEQHRPAFAVSSEGHPKTSFDGDYTPANDDGLAINLDSLRGATSNDAVDAPFCLPSGLCLEAFTNFAVAGGMWVTPLLVGEGVIKGPDEFGFYVSKIYADSGREDSRPFWNRIEGFDAEAFGIARYSHGDLVAVGIRYSTPGRVALVRLNQDLTVDTSFGEGDGIISHAIGSGDSGALEVAVQSDGKIVVVGGTGSSGERGPYAWSGAFVARFTSTGSLDPTFGTGGVVTFSQSDGTTNPAPTGGATGVQIASDGDIVVAGTTDMSSCLVCDAGPEGFVRRYTSTGVLDLTFGDGGVVTRSSATFKDLVLDSEDRITVVGASTGSGTAALAVRYTSDGRLDTFFGGGDGVAGFEEVGGLSGFEITSADISSDSNTIMVGGTSYGSNSAVPDRMFLARIVGGCGSTDVDNDGISDGCDNCPDTCNPDQANADGDAGGGDVCDVCPAIDEAAESAECTAAAYNSELACCRAMASEGISVDADGPSCGAAGDASFQTPPDPTTGTTVTVEIPSGAVDGPTSISVTPMTQGGGDYILSTAVGKFVTGAIMEPAGMTFDPPLLICMAWVDADNNGRVDNLEYVVDEGNIRPTLRDETTGTETVLGARCGLQRQCGAFGVDGLPATVPGTLNDGSLRACCSEADNVYCFEVRHFSAYAIADLSCAGSAIGRVIATRVDKPAGTQGLQVKGEFDLGSPIVGGLDPQATGFELVIQAADGTPLYQVTLPGGAYSRTTGEGWKTSAHGGSAQWKSKIGISGVTQVKLRWDDATGQGSFDLKGKGLSLAVTPDDLPLQAEVRLDPAALAGHCALATFTPPGEVCAFNGSGSTLLCQ